jgi:hypothetical protein
MTITLEQGPFFTFVLRSDSGDTRLVQRDDDFLGVARTFGWSSKDDESREAIWDAYDFLDRSVGETVDDPGYF